MAKRERKPKARVFKRATIGKRPPRNVYYDGTAGECGPPHYEPLLDKKGQPLLDKNGEPVTQEIIPLRATRKFGGGERFILAGVDLVISQRSAADKLGAIEIGRVESRTRPNGEIVTRFYGLLKSNRMKLLHEVVSHRFGAPVDLAPFTEETDNAKG